MKLDNRLAALSNIASADPSRPALELLRVENGEVVATDGVCLVSIKNKKYEGEKFAVKSVDLSEVTKMNKGSEEMEVIKNDTTIELIGTNKVGGFKQSIATSDLEFPDYKRIVPSEFKAITAFDLKLMRKMCDTLIKLGHTKVVMEVGEPLQAIKLYNIVGNDGKTVEAMTDKLLALLMPIKDEEAMNKSK